MPIYEYRCGACGHKLDALQKISDPLLTDCPDCGASALKKLMSAPVFRLKGSGWYETDFKSDKEKKRNLADGSGKEAAAKDGAAGDAKPGKADKSDKSDKSAGADTKTKPSVDTATKASTAKGAGTAAA
jgi:putative FmdB family regulatory protein